MRMRLPGPTCALRSRGRADSAPSQAAAASSNETLAGLCPTPDASRAVRYSAWAPNPSSRYARTPNTSSPTAKRVTSGPMDSTVPAYSSPRMRHFGRRQPLNARWNAGVALRHAQSLRLTVAARTRTRISPAAGAGRSTSPTRRTSGGPYRSWTAARIRSVMVGERYSIAVLGHDRLTRGRVTDRRTMEGHHTTEAPTMDNQALKERISAAYAKGDMEALAQMMDEMVGDDFQLEFPQSGRSEERRVGKEWRRQWGTAR